MNCSVGAYMWNEPKFDEIHYNWNIQESILDFQSSVFAVLLSVCLFVCLGFCIFWFENWR
jgi:hypothetical protein